MAKGEYWTLFLDLDKDIREIIQKYLLSIGFVDLASTVRVNKRRDFDEWIRLFQRMCELKLVSGKILLEKNIGRATIVFFMHEHFIQEIISDSDWRRKASQGLSWTKSSLQSERNKIDAINKEIIITYIENSGAASSDQISEKLSFFLSFRPFNEEFQNYDSISDLVKRYNMSDYSRDYLKRLYEMGRKEVNTKKRKERLEHVVEDFLAKNRIVKLEALTQAFSKKGVSENEVITVLRSQAKSFFMSGFARKKVSGPSMHNDYALMDKNDLIEITNNGKPANLTKFLREHDDILTLLIKDHYLPEIRLVQWGVGYGDKNKLIYVILKSAIREIIEDIVQKDKGGEDVGSYYQLLFFMALLHDVKNNLQKNRNQTDVDEDKNGDSNEVMVFGFGNPQQFYDLYLMLHEMITIREEIMIKRKKLDLWRSVEHKNFLMIILSIFSMSPSKKLEKSLLKNKQSVRNMAKAFRSGGGVKRSNMDIVIDAIAATIKDNLNPLQIVTLKNKIDANPEACLQYVSGGLARYLKAALEKESTRTMFINRIMDKITKLQGN